MGNCFGRRRHPINQQAPTMAVTINANRGATDDDRYVHLQQPMQPDYSPLGSPSPSPSPSSNSLSFDRTHHPESLESTEPNSEDLDRASQERERLRAAVDEQALRDREAMSSTRQAYQVPVTTQQPCQSPRPTSLNTPARTMKVIEDRSVREVTEKSDSTKSHGGNQAPASLPAPPPAGATAPHSLQLPKSTSAASSGFHKGGGAALPAGGGALPTPPSSHPPALPKGAALPGPGAAPMGLPLGGEGKSSSIKKKEGFDKSSASSSSAPKPTLPVGDKPAGQIPVQRSFHRVPFGSQTRLSDGNGGETAPAAGPKSELKMIQTRVVQGKTTAEAGAGGSGGAALPLPPAPKTSGLPTPHSLPLPPGASHALPGPGLPAGKTGGLPAPPAAAPLLPHTPKQTLPGPPPPLPPPTGAALPAPGVYPLALPAPRGGVLPSPAKPGQLPPSGK